MFEHKWLGRAIAAAMVALTLLYLAATAFTWMISTTGYAGVPLRGGVQDVLYAIGQPDLARNSPGEPWRATVRPAASSMWYYKSPGLTVRYDEPGGRVVEVYCENVEGLAGSCPGAFGANVGDGEQRLLEVLGTPSGGSIGGGRKLMRYDEAGLEFSLARGQVKGVRFTAPSGSSFDKLFRYLNWLIP